MKVSDIKNLLGRHIAVDHNTGCWLWTGVTNKQGYGKIRLGGRESKQWRVHILMYRLYKGEIIHEIDHECNVPSCVNPEHLFDRTSQHNLRRRHGWYLLEDRWYCRQGHLMDELNTIVRKNGRNACRKCDNEGQMRRYNARKANGR